MDAQPTTGTVLRTVLTTALLASGLVVLSTSASKACSCESTTFCEKFADADAVLRVRALSQTEGDGHIAYKARVARVFKGEIDDRDLTIVTANNSAACGVILPSGDDAPPVLIGGYWTELDAQPALEVNSCGILQVGSMARDVRSFLRDTRTSLCPECRSDADCNARQFCSAGGYCMRRCRDHADCRNGTECRQGQCVGGCVEDEDCEEGWCRIAATGNGSCVPFAEEGDACNVGMSSDEQVRCADGLVCACSQEAGDEPCEAICHSVPEPGPCGLEADPGLCLAAIQRWYFDGQACSRFTWGGCGGNDNNFETIEECRETCGGSPCDDLRCLPHQECRIHEDPNEGVIPYCADTCDGFPCRGGTVCELQDVLCIREPCPPIARCVPDPSTCDLPVEPGPCRAAIPRWYFNADSGRCEEFIYGGCQGNENNFESLAECRDACAEEPDPCATIRCRQYQECRVHQDADGQLIPYCADTCRDFPCPDGHQCELKGVICVREPCPPTAVCVPDEPESICSLPAEQGPCQAFLPRWYFNADSGQCEQFVYGGCQGNENNFQSQEQCARACRPVEPDPCTLPRVVGPCEAAIPRWYFNADSGQCEPFTYGGCQGNENNFESEAQCARTCRPAEPDPCTLPAEVGPCDALIPRWYFDADSGQCEEFNYGGCGGNANNFQSQTDCLGTCDPGGICELPPEVGPCDAVIPRWFFNSNTGQCERFIYGGCGGNANNFTSAEECSDACRDDCVCPRVLDPVCGADGQTYANECLARCAGVRVVHDGACRCEPCVCPDVYAPVCGADGRTYGNRCEARCAGVEVVHEGECRRDCECNADCPGNTVCRDQSCAPPCQVSCLVPDPVCGSDGRTYLCGQVDAACHGVSVVHEGECGEPCRDDGTCPGERECRKPDGCTDPCGCVGFCEPCVCPEIYDPVCGSDGQTYDNECFARCAGVDVAGEGECGECDCNADCPSGSVCRGGDCVPPCQVDCLVPDPVCGNDGRTYLCGEADASCHGAEVLFDGPCQGLCTPGDLCPDGTTCNEIEPCSAECGCPGRCAPCVCPEIYDPVCGVDGKTYGNQCHARCAHVDIAHEGECEERCRCNADCPSGSVCRDGDCGPPCQVDCFVPDPVCGTDGNTYVCGEADANCHGAEVLHEGECSGICRPGSTCPNGDLCVPPDDCPSRCGCPGRCEEPCVCPRIFDPVCGVNGETYGNACLTKCAGVEIAHEGECRGECRCNSDCASDEVCLQGSCSEPCVVACLVADPVCGTDGNTYVCGAADAKCHGVEVLHDGECGSDLCRPGSICPDGDECQPSPDCANGCGCVGRCETEPCACPLIFDPVCGEDGRTYGNACHADCAGVDIVHEGACETTVRPARRSGRRESNR